MGKTFTSLAAMPITFPSTTSVYPGLSFFKCTDNTQLQSDVEAGLGAAKKAGLNVFRTWGFNDRNRTTLANGLPQYGGEGAGPSPNVMQWWNNGTQEINLEPFDKVVKAAEKTGMKLIVALTNNWADYGGMDVYTINLGYKYHDDVSYDASTE
jgi:mannan endo-1,4-beta-mannosidase